MNKPMRFLVALLFVLVAVLFIAQAATSAEPQEQMQVQAHAGQCLEIYVDGVRVYASDACFDGGDTATPAPTDEPPPTATDAPSATPTDTPTDEPQPTATIPPAPTATPTATATEPPEPTATVPPAPTATPPDPGDTGDGEFIWISPDEIRAAGPLTPRIMEWANDDITPDLSDQDNNATAVVYASALACHATGDDSYCEKARSYVMAAIETENGGRTLALGRNLAAYVIAADLVGLSAGDDAYFRSWLTNVRYESLDGRTLISTQEDRPNNWGHHAGASRIAASLYIGDDDDVRDAADVFHGFLGSRETYDEFSYGSLSWQADPEAPVGINPMGSLIDGHNVDGVMPDDQRRSGSFTWPAPCGSYPHEAMQGIVAQAWLLHRAGFNAFQWEDSAVGRAAHWLYSVNECPAQGDDLGTPYLIDHIYGTSYASDSVNLPGKNGLLQFDWQFGG